MANWAQKPSKSRLDHGNKLQDGFLTHENVTFQPSSSSCWAHSPLPAPHHRSSPRNRSPSLRKLHLMGLDELFQLLNTWHGLKTAALKPFQSPQMRWRPKNNEKTNVFLLSSPLKPKKSKSQMKNRRESARRWAIRLRTRAEETTRSTAELAKTHWAPQNRRMLDDFRSESSASIKRIRLIPALQPANKHEIPCETPATAPIRRERW